MKQASLISHLLLVASLLFSSGSGSAAAVKALGALGAAAGAAKTGAVVSTSAGRVAPATGATVSRLGAASTVVKSGAKVEKPHQVDLSIVADVVQYMVPNGPPSDHKKR